MQASCEWSCLVLLSMHVSAVQCRHLPTVAHSLQWLAGSNSVMTAIEWLIIGGLILIGASQCLKFG